MIPIRISDSPRMAWPMFLTSDLFRSVITKPTPRRVNASAVVQLRKAVAATIHAVMVVPMFAPMITHIPCWSDRVATLTSPATRMVVALEDCTRAVIPAPERICLQGDEEAIHFSKRLSLSPKDFWIPELSISRPKMKRAIAPRRVKICKIIAV